MSDSQGSAQPTARMPRSGPPIEVGSRVVIRVSKGVSPVVPPGYATIPDLVGRPPGDALSALQDLGLTVDVVNDFNARVTKAHVVGTLPHAGQSVPTGTQAVMMVSSGPSDAAGAQTALPIVVGMTENQALAALQGNGLVPQVVYEYSAAVPEGIVIDQLPSATTVATAPPKKQSLAWLWILLAVLVVLGIGFVAWNAMRGMTPVPTVVGMTQADAQTAITAAGFKVGAVTTTQTASAADIGKVVAQTPLPGSSAKKGSAIGIVVSGGQQLVAVSTVTGMPQADAQAALTAVGLTFKITNGPSVVVPKGNVITQAPAAGQQVPPGTSVGLTVSSGNQNVAVPAVVGMSQSDAQSALKAVGLSAKSTTAYDSATKGDVYGQSPAAGTIVAPGTVVNIQVSNGPQPAPTQVTVPDVIGQLTAAATTKLQDLGFKVSVSQVSTFTAVSAQTPSGGSTANKGSTVKIVIGQN